MTDHETAHVKWAKKNVISPEEYILDKDYSITINPCDRFQYFGDVDRINKLKKRYELLLLEYPNVEHELYMEISRTGRLHFHGSIKFTSHKALLHYFLIHINEIMEVSNIDIDELKDPIVWMEYCRKSKHLIDVVVITKDCLKKYRSVKVDKNGVAHKSYFDGLV